MRKKPVKVDRYAMQVFLCENSWLVKHAIPKNWRHDYIHHMKPLGKKLINMARAEFGYSPKTSNCDIFYRMYRCSLTIMIIGQVDN